MEVMLFDHNISWLDQDQFFYVVFLSWVFYFYLPSQGKVYATLIMQLNINNICF